MALPDLTGQNIQDTYQRVVQTDGTNFYNGTGSLVQIVTDAVTSSMTVATASYAISASVEITHEVSSSYAQTASMASNNFIVQGHITASGDISSSGTIIANKIVSLGANVTNEAGTNSLITAAGSSGAEIKLYSVHGASNRDVGFHMSASSNGQEFSIGLARTRNTFYIAPSSVGDGPENTVFEIDASGNITASGNISSSGQLIGIVDGGNF